MHIFRATNLYLVGRSLNPEYMVCSSFYKLDGNVFTKLRTMSNSEQKYCTEKSTCADKEIAQKPPLRLFHRTSSQFNSVDEVSKQVLSFFQTIKMKDMAQAPEPVFWYSTAALIPFVAPPISFLIFGYYPFLATLQLTYAATLSAFAGGMKWGWALNDTEHKPTWENLGWSIVPQMMGWFGLLLPQQLGFLVVTTAIAVSTFIDLTSTCYPNWFKAIRLALTVPALLCLMITFLLRVFH